MVICFTCLIWERIHLVRLVVGTVRGYTPVQLFGDECRFLNACQFYKKVTSVQDKVRSIKSL